MDSPKRHLDLIERIEQELDPIEHQMFMDESRRIEERLPDTLSLDGIDVRASMRELATQNALLTMAVTKMEQNERERERRDAMKTKQFRVFRILTYTGTYEWLQQNFRRLGVPLRGSHDFGGGSISSTMIGELPELFSPDADDAPDDAAGIVSAITDHVESPLR